LPDLTVLRRLALTTIHPRFRLPASRLGSHPDIESIGGGRRNMLAIDIQSGLSEAWERIITFVPKFLGFLAILLIGYFVAKLVARLVDRLLERVGFGGWGGGGAAHTGPEPTRFRGSG